MGNGRRKGGGVQGAAGFCMGAGSGSMIVGMGFRSKGCARDDDGSGSSAGFGSTEGLERCSRTLKFGGGLFMT